MNTINNIGNKKIRRLIGIFGNPKNIYNSDISVINGLECLSDKDKKELLLSREEDKVINRQNELIKKGISFTYPDKDDYPDNLKEIEDYPTILYYKGSLIDNKLPCVAVVGARNCTNYGSTVAFYISTEFARMGIQVISGLALGIDSASHRGVVNINMEDTKNNAKTYAILGCGADVCYPRSNIELYENIINTGGGIISEYAPDTPPIAGQFPVRNRIISGISDAVVVVEAREKSGSLITADLAMEYNRDVYIVPGRIDDKLSLGCLSLLKEGADILIRPEDVLQTLGIADKIKRLSDNKDKGNNNKKSNLIEFNLASEKKLLYSELTLYPISLDELIKKTGLPFDMAGELLLELELEGLVREVSKNCYERVHF